MTQKLTLENEQIKHDEDDNQQTPKMINDNHLSLDNSLQISQPFITIEHENIPKEQQSIRKSELQRKHPKLFPLIFQKTLFNIHLRKRIHFDGQKIQKII
jgi:hypothetical protein